MILVTGGLGFIGAHTARGLLDLGESAVLTQYRVARNPDLIASEVGERIFVEQLDVEDEDAFLAIGKKHKITGIIHLAGTGSTPHDPFEDVAANTAGLLNALKAASEWGVRVSVASSVAVYANLRNPPFREDMQITVTAGHPIEAYKKSAEILTKYIAGRAGLEVVLLRIAGIYGPLYRSMSNLPSRFVHAAVKGEQVDIAAPRGPLYADDGSDLCDARDCGRAIALLQLAGQLNHDTYNVGAGRPTTAKDLLAAVQRSYPEFSVPLLDGNNPKGSGAATWLDISRLQEDTGYSPAFSLEDSISHYVEWIRSGHNE